MSPKIHSRTRPKKDRKPKVDFVSAYKAPKAPKICTQSRSRTAKRMDSIHSTHPSRSKTRAYTKRTTGPSRMDITPANRSGRSTTRQPRMDSIHSTHPSRPKTRTYIKRTTGPSRMDITPANRSGRSTTRQPRTAKKRKARSSSRMDITPSRQPSTRRGGTRETASGGYPTCSASQPQKDTLPTDVVMKDQSLSDLITSNASNFVSGKKAKQAMNLISRIHDDFSRMVSDTNKGKRGKKNVKEITKAMKKNKEDTKGKHNKANNKNGKTGKKGEKKDDDKDDASGFLFLFGLVQTK